MILFLSGKKSFLFNLYFQIPNFHSMSAIMLYECDLGRRKINEACQRF